MKSDLSKFVKDEYEKDNVLNEMSKDFKYKNNLAYGSLNSEMKRYLKEIENSIYLDTVDLKREIVLKIGNFENSIFRFMDKFDTYYKDVDLVDKKVTSKIEEFNHKIEKFANIVATVDTKQKEIETKLSFVSKQVENIISDNLLVPSLVGPKAKYKNLKEFVIFSATNFKNFEDTSKKIEESKNSIETFARNIDKIKKDTEKIKTIEMNTVSKSELNMNLEKVNKKINLIETAIKSKGKSNITGNISMLESYKNNANKTDNKNNNGINLNTVNISKNSNLSNNLSKEYKDNFRDRDLKISPNKDDIEGNSFNNKNNDNEDNNNYNDEGNNYEYNENQIQIDNDEVNFLLQKLQKNAEEIDEKISNDKDEILQRLNEFEQKVNLEGIKSFMNNQKFENVKVLEKCEELESKIINYECNLELIKSNLKNIKNDNKDVDSSSVFTGRENRKYKSMINNIKIMQSNVNVKTLKTSSNLLGNVANEDNNNEKILDNNTNINSNSNSNRNDDKIGTSIEIADNQNNENKSNKKLVNTEKELDFIRKDVSRHMTNKSINNRFQFNNESSNSSSEEKNNKSGKNDRNNKNSSTVKKKTQKDINNSNFTNTSNNFSSNKNKSNFNNAKNNSSIILNSNVSSPKVKNLTFKDSNINLNSNNNPNRNPNKKETNKKLSNNDLNLIDENRITKKGISENKNFNKSNKSIKVSNLSQNQTKNNFYKEEQNQNKNEMNQTNYNNNFNSNNNTNNNGFLNNTNFNSNQNVGEYINAYTNMFNNLNFNDTINKDFSANSIKIRDLSILLKDLSSVFQTFSNDINMKIEKMNHHIKSIIKFNHVTLFKLMIVFEEMYSCLIHKENPKLNSFLKAKNDFKTTYQNSFNTLSQLNVNNNLNVSLFPEIFTKESKENLKNYMLDFFKLILNMSEEEENKMNLMDTISRFGVRKNTCSKFHNNTFNSNSNSYLSNNNNQSPHENDQLNMELSDIKISKIYLKDKDNFSMKNKHKTVMSTLFLKGTKDDKNIDNKKVSANDSKTNLPIYKINNNYDRVNEILQLRSASTMLINSRKKVE